MYAERQINTHTIRKQREREREKARKKEERMASVECCTPAPPAHHICSGVVETWGTNSVYVNAPPGASKAVLLVADVFGWEAPLLRKLADKIATAGYLGVVPDYLHGDAYINIEDATHQERINKWLPKHPATPEPVEESKEIIGFLKEKGVRSIGVAGFCWGAQVAVYLAKGAHVQAAVLMHPSFVTTEDIKEVKVPIAILAAEIDRTSPPALIREFEKILVSKSEVCTTFCEVYPRVAHGWTIRYKVNDEKAVAEAEEAHAALLEWFGKSL
ncbi:hypothetical protein O6H91_06G075000 [Diphasiastrum complanatum]|uniref:Uncharacterized protein n=1 Tax=Diphasiastrum complanatum TaxID=34168 RepID=A0ACC2DFD2_DIPCM|nr:hypothetical protein O6H91_06G075000 [Diphasiastrum complanatum]